MRKIVKMSGFGLASVWLGLGVYAQAAQPPTAGVDLEARIAALEAEVQQLKAELAAQRAMSAPAATTGAPGSAAPAPPISR